MTRARVIWGVVSGGALLALSLYLTQRRSSLSEPTCRLDVPNSTIDPIVFPTKGGSASLDAAIIGDAEPAVIQRVLREQGGFSVPRGTACSALESGPTYSRVLVTEGPFSGKTVWVPALHTHG